MLDASSPPEVEAEPAETEELEEAGSEMDGSGVVYRISAVPWTTSLAGAAVTAVAVAKLAAVVKAGPDLRRVKKLRGLLLTKYESVIDTAEELHADYQLKMRSGKYRKRIVDGNTRRRKWRTPCPHKSV